MYKSFANKTINILLFFLGAKLVYKESKPDGVGVIQSLDVGSIRSVKVSDLAYFHLCICCVYFDI